MSINDYLIIEETDERFEIRMLISYLRWKRRVQADLGGAGMEEGAKTILPTPQKTLEPSGGLTLQPH